MPLNIVFLRPQNWSQLKPYYYSTIAAVKGKWRKRAQTQVRKRARKSAKQRKRVQKSALTRFGNSQGFQVFLAKRSDNSRQIPIISSNLLQNPTISALAPFRAPQNWVTHRAVESKI